MKEKLEKPMTEETNLAASGQAAGAQTGEAVIGHPSPEGLTRQPTSALSGTSFMPIPVLSER